MADTPVRISPRRDLSFFYPSPEYSGYGKEKSNRRFSVLHDIPNLGSCSLLDVGSGPCNLLHWLRTNGYATQYEPVDIREDSLRLCPCAHTHTRMPTGARDIVCLFGTVTFNIGSDQKANRLKMRELLSQSMALNPKHIVFTAIRADKIDGISKIQLIGYDREQVLELVEMLTPVSYQIYEDEDPTEWIVRCDFQ